MINMGELFGHSRMLNLPMDRVPLNEKEKSNSLVEAGDLLFARQSLVRDGAGQCSIFIGDEEEVCFESHLIRCRLKKDLANPLFYFYYFFSRAGKTAIDSIIEQGAGAAGIRGSDLCKVLVPDIDLEDQNKIAAIFDELDNKIELNRQINKTLEQIAQAIFKSWFVDFEPTRAKIAARKRWQAANDRVETSSPTCYADQFDSPQNAPTLEQAMTRAAMAAISGKTEQELDALSEAQQQQLKATADLFPDALVESELGEIPEGWTLTRLDNFIDLNYGKALKKNDRIDGDFPVYGSGGIAGYHNTALVKGPGVIVGRKGTVGSIYWEDRNFYPIDTTYYLSVKNQCSLLFAYHLMETLGLERMNTDAAVPGLNRNNVYRIEVPEYPHRLIEIFTKVITPVSDKMVHSRDESHSLSLIRDNLLPKLLSGETPLLEMVDS